MPPFDLRFATPDEAREVGEVIQEAARWITTWRAQLWDPELVGEAFAAPIIARGHMLGAWAAEGIAGVVVVEPEDPHFWPDHPPGEAVYLHKLAVRRAYAGQGLPALLVDEAARLASAEGRRFLRLDCDPPLSGFYQRLGFAVVDEVDVDHPEAGRMRVARMERGLAADA